ncbi:MAG: ABC transporter substrate-binding protein [Pseudomonadota bacterium]
MDRRAALRTLLALGATPWARPGHAESSDLALIRINIPGPSLLPFIPIELIPLLGIDHALGAQLAIRYLPSGVQALENVVAGDAHFAGVAFPAMPSFALKGKPVVALATLSSGTPPYAVLVRNDLDRKIRSLKDLRGRSIGIQPGSATTKTYLQVLMELWLASHGVKSEQVRWVPTNMNFDGIYGALASGSVDAVFCEEPLSGTLVRKRIGTLLASLSDPANPARFVGQQHLRAVLASTPSVVAGDPRRAELMVRMLQRAMAWVRRTPPAVVAAKLDIKDAELAVDIADALRRMPRLFSPDGRFLESEIRSTRQFIEAARTPMPPGFDIRSLIDDRWVRKAG